MIEKNYKQRRSALEAVRDAVAAEAGGELDEMTRERFVQGLEALKQDEAKELTGFEKDCQMRKAEGERLLATQALARESKQVAELQVE